MKGVTVDQELIETYELTFTVVVVSFEASISPAKRSHQVKLDNPKQVQWNESCSCKSRTKEN